MKCIVKNCSNNPGKFNPGISFHRLPKCQIKRNVWLENLGWEQKSEPSQYSIVCSDHFPSNSFIYGKNANKPRLNENAIPKIVRNKPVDGEKPFQNVNDQPQTNNKNKGFQKKDANYEKTKVYNNICTTNNVKHKKTTPVPVATETVNKTISNNATSLPSNVPEKLTEQILVQLSNLDTQKLKSIINNSNAKFESALQAQARKQFRSELRKKLRNFNLIRDQSVNNVAINHLIDSGKISNDVLKKIEEVFKLDIFQGNESHEEISEVVEESEADYDIGSSSNDVLSDTYLLLVKYGLIPALSNPEIIGETNKINTDLSQTIINVDEYPSDSLIYEDSTNNITNDDVILIEPRREIITIGSPEHEPACDEFLYNGNMELQPDIELENQPNDHFLNNGIQGETEQIVKIAEQEILGTRSLIENAENYLCSSILTIIKEYNANLQKCYKDKKEIDSTIVSLQSKRESLENTIAEIQSTQTQLLELFLRKSNCAMTESQNSLNASSPGVSQRKRKLSTNSSISSQEIDKHPRYDILETNGNSLDSTVITISNSDRRSTTNTDSQLQKRNFQDHTRNHSSDVKDIIKTNDYLLVSAGTEILRYSCNNLELEKVYKRHRALVTGVYVLNNEYVFSVSFDMNLHKFSLEGFQNPLSTHCFKESLTALEYGWNNLFIASSRGRIIAFNIETNKICLDFHSDVKNTINTLKTVEVTNKKYLTVLTSKSLYLYICDGLTGSIIRTIETFNYINDISIDNDSIYCGLNSNELLTFSIFSGRPHDPKELDTKSTIKCVKTYKNLVLIGCCDGYIHVYHKSTNLYLDIVRVTDKGLISFEVYPRKIVFCSADKSLTINDMPQQITMYLE